MLTMSSSASVISSYPLSVISMIIPPLRLG
nr:MAG TPA: hypothetical protein [Caudoviricetes sp.]